MKHQCFTIFDFHLFTIKWVNIRNNQQIKSQNRQCYRSISFVDTCAFHQEYGLWISFTQVTPRACCIVHILLDLWACRVVFFSIKANHRFAQDVSNSKHLNKTKAWGSMHLTVLIWHLYLFVFRRMKKNSLSNLFCCWKNAAVSVSVDVFDAIICVEWSPCFQQWFQRKKCCTLNVWLYVLVCTVL